MAVTSAEELFAVLEKSKLLIPSQLARARQNAGQSDDPKAIAKSLARQGLITRWQGGQLLAGRSSFYLGKYRLIELIGHGGAGNVFLGRHVTMNRSAALKILSRRVGRDPTMLRRFLTAARAIATLDHPNVVQVYSVDNEGDRYYLVMEYVEGVDLQRLVDQYGPLGYDLAADYIRQAADGLEHAHQQNMIHCDMKPSKLLVNLQGVVKIVDLGLAWLVSSEMTADSPREPVVESVDYLAPEQTRNDAKPDARTDIYALGCTFYFLLTGHPPFSQGTPSERIQQRQTEEPPDLRVVTSKIPADLAAICKRMLAKEPDDRYQSAADLSRALVEWHASLPRLLRATPLPRAKRLADE